DRGAVVGAHDEGPVVQRDRLEARRDAITDELRPALEQLGERTRAGRDAVDRLADPARTAIFVERSPARTHIVTLPSRTDTTCSGWSPCGSTPAVVSND